ncbi:MAG: phosphotransferase family protein [Solirubrobacteraceae bacterium]
MTTDTPALTAEKLQRFLARRRPNATTVAVRDVVPLTGGYSCVTVRFTAEIDGEPVQLVARQDAPAETVVQKTDRVREWRVLEALTRQGGVPMPAALHADEDGSELGAPTIVLELAEGGSFLAKVRGGDEATQRECALQMADLAAALHATDVSALPQDVERPQDWDEYVVALAADWRAMEERLSDSYPMIRYMAAWLEANRPAPAPLGLVHGEFQPSNQVLDGDGGLQAIDWEFVHVGDPREDLGWCQWCESVQPPVLIGMDPEAFCARYRQKSGLGEDVINPLTLAYFSILPAVKVFGNVLDVQQAFADGEASGFRTAFLVGAVATAFEGWFGATAQIERAASAGRSEVAA